MAAQKPMPTKANPRKKAAKRKSVPRTSEQEPDASISRCPGYDPTMERVFRFRYPEDLLGCVRDQISVFETIGLALRNYEPDQEVGSICEAFRQAVEQLRDINSAIADYFEESEQTAPERGRVRRAHGKT